jgi:hypothetical protein
MMTDRRLVILGWLLLLSPLPLLAFSIQATSRIQLQPSPLIGGPAWLPVHVKVVIDEKYVFDYVPRNAASTETLKRLVTLQAVPAQARSWIAEDEDDTHNIYAQRAQEFCEQYSKDLHLIRNNCWTFAFEMIQHVTQQQNEE